MNAPRCFKCRHSMRLEKTMSKAGHSFFFRCKNRKCRRRKVLSKYKPAIIEGLHKSPTSSFKETINTKRKKKIIHKLEELFSIETDSDESFVFEPDHSSKENSESEAANNELQDYLSRVRMKNGRFNLKKNAKSRRKKIFHQSFLEDLPPKASPLEFFQENACPNTMEEPIVGTSTSAVESIEASLDENRVSDEESAEQEMSEVEHSEDESGVSDEESPEQEIPVVEQPEVENRISDEETPEQKIPKEEQPEGEIASRPLLEEGTSAQTIIIDDNEDLPQEKKGENRVSDKEPADQEMPEVEILEIEKASSPLLEEGSSAQPIVIDDDDEELLVLQEKKGGGSAQPGANPLLVWKSALSRIQISQKVPEETKHKARTFFIQSGVEREEVEVKDVPLSMKLIKTIAVHFLGRKYPQYRLQDLRRNFQIFVHNYKNENMLVPLVSVSKITDGILLEIVLRASFTQMECLKKTFSSSPSKEPPAHRARNKSRRLSSRASKKSPSATIQQKVAPTKRKASCRGQQKQRPLSPESITCIPDIDVFSGETSSNKGSKHSQDDDDDDYEPLSDNSNSSLASSKNRSASSKKEFLSSPLSPPTEANVHNPIVEPMEAEPFSLETTENSPPVYIPPIPPEASPTEEEGCSASKGNKTSLPPQPSTSPPLQPSSHNHFDESRKAEPISSKTTENLPSLPVLQEDSPAREEGI